jgi:phosphoglycerate kinase
MKGLGDANLSGKRVFMRVDFNVPMEGGKITDDFRIASALGSIKKVLSAGAKLVLASHLGRPAEKGYEAEFSLAPVAARLSELLGKPVKFVPDCVGEVAEKAVAALKDGEVALLENLRFYPGEARQRRGVREEAREARGRVRQRRVRHFAPRRGVDDRRPEAAGRRRRGRPREEGGRRDLTAR